MLRRIQPDRRLPSVLLLSGLMLAGCERPAKAPAPAPSAPPVAVAEAPRLPALPPPALGRAEVLQALDAASSAYAAGRSDDGQALAGRRFVIRQAFGCPGSTSADGGADAGLARWKALPSAIEISLKPADWTEAPIMAGADAHWEAIEGLWLVRPWLRGEGCPTVKAGDDSKAAQAPPAPQTAGLAAVFERGGSRVGRRDGKAFSYILRGAPPPQPPAEGYRLVLEGRLTAFPDGHAIRCHAAGPDTRPLCVAAAEVDRVAFEDADGKLLSEWRP